MNFFKKRSALLIYTSLFSLCFLLTIPPFLNDYIVGHDMLYHLNWNELFQTQLFQGDLYPRWLFDMKGGRGSPVFYFYSPLPYYFSALFSLLIPSSQSAWYSLGAACLFALFVSSVGMFWFLKSYAETKYAYVFTLFYILYPYHLVVDLYIRFAYAEFFAITWIPYIFLCIRQVGRGERKAVWYLAILYALLILSHIPTTLLITPFFIVFALINTRTVGEKLSILSGFSLGVALTSFYLLPILFLKKFVSIGRMMTGDLLYKNSFLFIDNILPVKRFEFWTLLENLSLISILITILAFYATAQKNKNICFFFIACLFCIAMMYPFSKYFWEITPLLKIVQLPWRFYIVLSFTLLMLSVYTGERHQRATNVIMYSRFLTIIILVSISTMTLYKAYNKSTGEIAERHKKTIERSLNSRYGVAEYLSASTPENYYNKVSNYQLERIENLFTGSRENINYEHRLTGDHIIVRIDSPEQQAIIFNQFYFPTWEGVNTDEDKPVKFSRSSDGFLEFNLAKGISILRITHKTAVSEIIGLIISALVSCYVLFSLYTSRKETSVKTYN